MGAVDHMFAGLCGYPRYRGYLGEIITCILCHCGTPGKHTGFIVSMFICQAADLRQVGKWARRKEDQAVLMS